MQYKKYEEVAERIAEDAGKHILSEMKKGLKIKEKTSALDLVTNIDLSTEKLIREEISKLFPKHSIFGEEFSGDLKKSDYLWVIDPIDGTSTFATGKPGFSISIAMLDKYEPVVGVVFDVMNNKLYSASKNNGVRVNKKLLVKKNNSEAIIGLRNNTEPYRTELSNILNDAKIKWGYFPSTALAFCVVAEGNSCGMVKLTYNPWDIAGGLVIAKEFGCEITDCFGNEIKIKDVKKRNHKGIICAHKEHHGKLKETIRNARHKKGI